MLISNKLHSFRNFRMQKYRFSGEKTLNTYINSAHIS